MDFFKALKRTTIAATAAGMLALGATDAAAIQDPSVLGHISVSVLGTLGVTEINAINFGNIAFDGTGACATTTCAGDSVLTLSDKGNRNLVAGTDKMILLVGVANGANDANGIPDGGNLGTGGQAPGFYNITNADGITNVYVSFSNNSGAIMDANHPNNYISLNGAGGSFGGVLVDEFRVQNFTWEMDTAGAGPSASGYTGTANTPDIFGNFVACGNNCTIRVGADLHTVATKPNPTFGQYRGTFYLMVSY
jgi:hypothetical protein